MQPLIIVGAGGFGREIAQAVHGINDARPTYDLLGFLDDAGLAEVDGLPVLGPIAGLAGFPDAQVVISTGHPGNYFSRKRIVRRLALPASRYATLIHPLASVGRSVVVGEGCVFLPGSVATASVTVGSHVAVMPGAVFTHDNVIGSFATFGSGARLAGRTVVEEGAYVGSGALVRQECRVGAWSLVGMGSVVIADVPAGEVWAGVPARRLRPVDIPADLLP